MASAFNTSCNQWADSRFCYILYTKPAHLSIHVKKIINIDYYTLISLVQDQLFSPVKFSERLDKYLLHVSLGIKFNARLKYYSYTHSQLKFQQVNLTISAPWNQFKCRYDNCRIRLVGPILLTRSVIFQGSEHQAHVGVWIHSWHVVFGAQGSWLTCFFSACARTTGSNKTNRNHACIVTCLLSICNRLNMYHLVCCRTDTKVAKPWCYPLISFLVLQVATFK